MHKIESGTSKKVRVKNSHAFHESIPSQHSPQKQTPVMHHMIYDDKPLLPYLTSTHTLPWSLAVMRTRQNEHSAS